MIGEKAEGTNEIHGNSVSVTQSVVILCCQLAAPVSLKDRKIVVVEKIEMVGHLII
jgi:hypothetical protein